MLDWTPNIAVDTNVGVRQSDVLAVPSSSLSLSHTNKYELQHSVIQDEKNVDGGYELIYRGNELQFEQELKKLSVGTHKYRVRSVNELGESDFSAEFSFQIKQGLIPQFSIHSSQFKTLDVYLNRYDLICWIVFSSVCIDFVVLFNQ